MRELPPLQASDIVRSLVAMGQVLSSPQPLRARLEHMCERTAGLLSCDRSSIMMWDPVEELFLATYNFGNPPDIAKIFSSHRASIADPLIAEAFRTQSHVVANAARSNPDTARIAAKARIESIVLAPMFDIEGEPLGFMTAEFNEQFALFDEVRAEIVRGAATLAQGVIIVERERLARRSAGRLQREILDQLLSSEDRTRRQISADIHDDPLQRVTALKHVLELLSMQAAGTELEAKLDAAVVRAAQAARSLRDVVQHVHPLSVDIGGLGGALETTLGRMADRHAWRTSFSNTITHNITPAVVTVLYRIAQQALDNVAAHAAASQVSVAITSDAQTAAVTIADDGTGFDQRLVGRDRFGLIAMTERAEYVNGTCRIESSPGNGTVVTARVPLR